MAIRISKKQLESIIIDAIANVLNKLKTDHEFVNPANDNEILPVGEKEDNEIFPTKEKEQTGDDILLID